MSWHVRGFHRSDIAPLVALQHATAGRVPAWSAAYLEGELTDPGRDHGRRVIIVASDDGHVRAGAGYVPAGTQFFVAPSLVGDADAGVALLDELVRRAAGADFVRMSCNDGEHAKRAALERLGFAPSFAFITLVRATDPSSTPRATPGFHRVPVADVPLEALTTAHNAAFRGVANSPEQSLDEVRFVVDRLVADASGVWLDDSGGIGGYVWILRDGDSRGAFHIVDSVGVVSARRRTGLGHAMIEHATRVSADAGIGEIRALIASNNTASLGLHAAAGFSEGWRRVVYQRDLPTVRPT